MPPGDNPELGIAITGTSDSAVSAAKAGEDALMAVTKAALDAGFASDALTRAQEDAAAAFYDVVKAAEAEKQTLSSVDVALTQNIKAQGDAYNSVVVALNEKRIALEANIAAQREFDRQMENGLAVVRAQAEAARDTGQALEDLGGHGSSALGKIVQSGRLAHGAMLGLNTAAQGGIATFAGLARAGNDVIIMWQLLGRTVLSASPWLLLATAIGGVLGILRGLTSHFGEHKAAVDKAGKSHKDFQDEAKKDLKQIDDDVKRLTASYTALEHEISAAEQATKALGKAQEKLAEDTITADAKIRESKAKSANEEKRIKQEALDLINLTKNANEANDVINERLAANLSKRTADAQSSALAGKRREVEGNLAQKQQAFDQAVGSISNEAVTAGLEENNGVNFKDLRAALKGSLNPISAAAGGIGAAIGSLQIPEGDAYDRLRSAQKEALAARAARDAAQTELERFDTDVRPQQTKLEDQSRAADRRLETADIQEQDVHQKGLSDRADRDIEINQQVRAIIEKENITKAGQAGSDASFAESITEAQKKVYSSQGAAYASNLITLNKIVDLYQASVKAYEKVIRDLEAQRRRLEAARSFQSPGS